MNFLFLMDPLETLNVRKDTSFAFMVGAHRRGHEIHYLPHGGISLVNRRVVFDTVPVVPQVDQPEPFERGEPVRLTDEQVDAVFIRSDPPFNERYLMNTWLLDRLPAHVPVINAPRGLRTVNEKLWISRFTDLVPPTLVTSRLDQFQAFLGEHRRIIAKPTDGHGGAGVFLVSQGDTNAAVIFETLTQQGRCEAIFQTYVAEADVGDKRILLLDGRPLGAVLRVHSEGDHRNNFFAGGKPHPTELTERDLHIIEQLKPHLHELGLLFVGIDVIGDYLIELNVTSPTGVQEINRLYNKQLEDQVIAAVEQMVQQQRSAV